MGVERQADKQIERDRKTDRQTDRVAYTEALLLKIDKHCIFVILVR